MGMYDIVRFSEKISKELELPDDEFQTKHFEEPGLDKIEISELIHKEGKLFKEPIIFDCCGYDDMNYRITVTVVAGNGKVLRCVRTSSKDGRYGCDYFCIMPKLVCPACKIAGCVFSEKTTIKCGACSVDLILSTATKCNPTIVATAKGTKCL